MRQLFHLTAPQRPTMKLFAVFRLLYVLEPMLIEPGLGTLQHGRDHLASDEPEVLLTSPT